MADHVEKVIVQGEVEMDTKEAEQKLENLKKPLTVQLDVKSNNAIKDIKKDIKSVQKAINELDFGSFNKKVLDASKNTQKAVKDMKKHTDKMSKAEKKKKSGILSDSEYDRASKLAMEKVQKYFDGKQSIVVDLQTSHLESGLSKVSAKIKTLDGQWQSFSAKISKSGDFFDKAFKGITNTSGLEKKLEKLNKLRPDNIRKQISELNSKINKYSSQESKFVGTNQYQKILPELTKVKSALTAINTEMSKTGNNVDFSKISNQLNDIAPAVKKIDTAFSDLNQSVSKYEANIAANSSQKWLEDNTRAAKKYGEQIKLIIDLQRSATSKGELASLNKQMKSIQSSASAEGLVGKSWIGSFKKNLGSVTQLLGSVFTLDRVEDVAVEMVSSVHEVDDALTDLKMATGVSDTQAQSLMDTYSQMGKELKATGVDIAKSSTEWLKQGKSIAEAQKLTEDSIILSKVGDLTSEESTKYLTSAMKGFKIEAKDALGIVDQLSAVDMASATDVGGLAEAMSKTAVTAQDAGIEMQRLIGYIATVGEVTQADMGSVGNAFKTIFTRMSDIKAGKFKLIDEDGTTETLSDVEQTLANVGIDLRKTVTEYNDYGDVLDNLAAKWDSLSQLQQNALAKAFAGTRQAEVFRTLMSNYDSAKKYMEVAYDSSGYATEKFEAYKNSLSGSIEDFKNSFQSLSNTLIGSNFLKGIVDAGAGALDILDSLIDKFDVLSSLATGIGIFQGLKGGG